MEKYTNITKKISCVDNHDLAKQINEVEGEVIRCTKTTPNSTDTNMWYELYIKVPVT